MNFEQIKEIISNNLNKNNQEFTRVFHGRGGAYPSFEFLTIDLTKNTIFIVFFNKISESLENKIFDFFENIFIKDKLFCIILQRRYLEKAPTSVLFGTSSLENFAIENGLKYRLNFLQNQNIGFFPDMRKGREFVREIAKDKNVLNLFSYTCAFSVCAIEAGALKVVNVDMSKQSLSTGRDNHRLNNHDTKKVKFMPHNILKSWNKIKNSGPYDLIIIDPPSFQKGSFAATKDYEKIIKRLDTLASKECLVLSCLNAPELDSNFILEQFKSFAKDFLFVKRLDNVESFKALDEEKSLKSMIFSNYGSIQ